MAILWLPNFKENVDMNKDIAFCIRKNCPDTECFRHMSQLEPGDIVNMADMYDKDSCPPQSVEIKIEEG